MEDTEICHCNNVSKNEITNAICQHGYTSVAEIQNKLKAGIICGRCIPEIRDILAKQNQ
ncbi:(2Fe-2S)-binding protein [Paludibacter jiangxiensis]|uniref:Nitrite reductase (NADH) large subunit n=1 Tax=Paludibacter jiangxiensis TaxID=681398 RepID=A0A170Y9I8_9BACT|nr:(2Fe-2S)-binding protein [Paludibacter jiangxiensis]GAT61621.1 nitrite reductase (NADH) large subunit [Paludibacter jiangxiensis]